LAATLARSALGLASACGLFRAPSLPCFGEQPRRPRLFLDASLFEIQLMARREPFSGRERQDRQS